MEGESCVKNGCSSTKKNKLRALFLDIGGVLLTNGWDTQSRKRAAKTFGFDFDAFESRHKQNVDLFEIGKLSLPHYLERTIFYKERSFTREGFIDFMYAQSEALPNMLELIHELKNAYSLKIGIISNESREINAYRIKKFKLAALSDFFISSSFVGMRKPDEAIYDLALDVAQVPKHAILYIDDNALFVNVAGELGIPGHIHKDFESTKQKLKALLAV